jgi:hypothetical protein
MLKTIGFAPLPDITAWELAHIWPLFTESFPGFGSWISDERIKRLPSECLRHLYEEIDGKQRRLSDSIEEETNVKT